MAKSDKKSSGITRKAFGKRMLAGLGGTALLNSWSFAEGAEGKSSGHSERRPNILLIMADDMGFSDVGCYGGEISTPNMDGLAAEGMRFTQFYNAARCCPTRASLLTGLYPHQAGMGDMVDSHPDPSKPDAYQGYLNNQCVTLAEVLGQAGYQTLMSGKWHVGEDRPHWPTNRGFDRYFGLISGAANYFDIDKAKPGRHRQMALDGEPYRPPKHAGFYMTDAITDRAVGMVEEAAGQDDPFFLYTAYTAPHYPLMAWPEDIWKYAGKYRTGWDVLRQQRYQAQLALGIINDKWELSGRYSDVPEWSGLSEEKKAKMARHMAVYAAQVDRMDRGIGRILQQLEATGQKENTLVLFLSDNGGVPVGGYVGKDWRNNGLPPGGVNSYMSYGNAWANVSDTPFRYFKKWVHEGGISTPLIARWPAKIAPGSMSGQMGHVADIMATICDVTGADYPRRYQGHRIHPMQGKSLKPALEGQPPDNQRTLCWEHEGHKAIRSGAWKLVATEGHRWELYNMETDRTEVHDVSATYPGKQKDLQQDWKRWADRVGVYPKPS